MVTYADYAVEGPVIFGAIGLRRVGYQGTRRAIITGACTGHRYEFGEERRAGYVDARDVEGLMGLLDQDGGALFEAAS